MSTPARWLSDSTLEHLRDVADWPDLSATKYEAISVLGRGGMATVYLAHDRELGREVALKVGGPSASGLAEVDERLGREARILAHLEHSGLVPVHDLGRLPDGRVFYVMKRVRGHRLDEHLRDEPSLPARLRILERTCDAVAFAHAHGIVHRDLKPENVMIGPFGEVLVLDWGVAKLRGDPCEVAAATPFALGPLTQRGAVVGTPGYMAPEQARGQDVDARADVYALGGILRLMLTGDVPRPLASILAKALADERDHRYPGARELGEDLARFLSSLPVLAHREGLLERVRRLAVKYRTPLGLVLAYVLMRGVLIYFTRR